MKKLSNFFRVFAALMLLGLAIYNYLQNMQWKEKQSQTELLLVRLEALHDQVVRKQIKMKVIFLLSYINANNQIMVDSMVLELRELKASLFHQTVDTVAIGEKLFLQNVIK